MIHAKFVRRLGISMIADYLRKLECTSKLEYSAAIISMASQSPKIVKTISERADTSYIACQTSIQVKNKFAVGSAFQFLSEVELDFFFKESGLSSDLIIPDAPVNRDCLSIERYHEILTDSLSSYFFKCECKTDDDFKDSMIQVGTLIPLILVEVFNTEELSKVEDFMKEILGRMDSTVGIPNVEYIDFQQKLDADYKGN